MSYRHNFLVFIIFAVVKLSHGDSGRVRRSVKLWLYLFSTD